MKKKSYPGVNVQWPISELILSGEKTVETRTYPIPGKFLGQEMVLIETPGPRGLFAARARAIVIFKNSFQYMGKADFYRDYSRHLVDKKSPWAWVDEKPKWGWELQMVRLTKPKLVPSKGIVFTREVFI